MCSHYQTLKDAELLLKKFGVRAKPAAIGKYDMWPRYQGVFVRRPVEHDAGDEAVPEREAVVGRWGLISAMTKADNLDKAGKPSTFNTRSETAPKSFTFGNAWRRAQHCIIPADAIFEPDWRSGIAVATRFTPADGAAGQVQESYTMLTINADEDPLFTHYQKAGKEKRLIVILPEGAYGDWLTAPAEVTRGFLVPSPQTSSSPDLLHPKLLTFASDRGMMSAASKRSTAALLPTVVNAVVSIVRRTWHMAVHGPHIGMVG